MNFSFVVNQYSETSLTITIESDKFIKTELKEKKLD